tara:strand:- start:1166 stop:1402 length:237 start_codon:yes stop_codon:yes gene_type:complete
MIQEPLKIKKVYKGTAEQLKEELSHITLENMKRYKEYKSRWDDFYSMWLRFGPDAARTILIPYIWRGDLRAPSEIKDV